MPVRYYPSSRVRVNQVTRGDQLFLNGKPYVGLFYSTYDGKYYSGPNPMTGPNEELLTISAEAQAMGLIGLYLPIDVQKKLLKSSKSLSQVSLDLSTKSYYPKPTQPNYDLGYIDRYFVKRENDKGYIMEISPLEYANINNGTATYDTTFLATQKIRWKLTGPLNSIRISQYDTRAGIIDTNKRLVEAANPNFFGLIEFIGGEYSKWAKPTK